MGSCRGGKGSIYMGLGSRNRLISLPHVRRCRDTVMPFLSRALYFVDLDLRASIHITWRLSLQVLCSKFVAFACFFVVVARGYDDMAELSQLIRVVCAGSSVRTTSKACARGASSFITLCHTKACYRNSSTATYIGSRNFEQCTSFEKAQAMDEKRMLGMVRLLLHIVAQGNEDDEKGG